MSPKASSPARGDPLSSHPLLRDSPLPRNEDTKGRAPQLLGPWVKEGAAESGDIRN